MFKKIIFLIIILLLSFPLITKANNGQVNINCEKQELKTNETTTCQINTNVTEGIYAVDFYINKETGLEVSNVKKSSVWTIGNTNSDYNDSNKKPHVSLINPELVKGKNTVVTFSIKSISAQTKKLKIEVKNITIVTSNEKEEIRNNLTYTFDVTGSGEPIPSGEEIELPTQGNAIIKNNTNVSSAKFNINTDETFKIYDKDDKEKTTGIIGTGNKIKIFKNNILQKEYLVVVKGDANGDGKISLTDLRKTFQHRLGKTNLTGVYLEAIDIDINGKISLTDLRQIFRLYLNKK